jgi:hypothetical protein
MALDLTMTITADGSQAKRELAEVERSVKGVETASTKAVDPVTKMAQALSGQGTAATGVVKANTDLDSTTKKLTGSTTENTRAVNDQFTQLILAGKASEAWALQNKSLDTTVKTLSGSTAAMTGAVGLSTTALSVMAAGAIVALAAVGALVAVLVKSTQHYFEHSEATKASRDALESLDEAWGRFQMRVGGAVLGDDFSIVKPVKLLNVALFLASTYIEANIDYTYRWINALKGLPGMGTGLAFADYLFSSPGDAQFLNNGLRPSVLPGGPMRGNPEDINYTPEQRAAMDRYESDQYHKRIALEQAELEKQMREANAERKRQEAERKRLQDAVNRQMAADILGWATPRVDHMYDWVSNGTSTGIGMTQRELLDAGISDASMRAAMDAGQGIFTRPRGDDIWALPPQNITAESLFPGGNFMGIAPRRDQSGMSGLFGAGFGSSAQFGNQLSATVLQAITGGGSMLGGVGSMIGGGLGSGLAKILTGGAGVAIGGFAGGALNAVLPGVGSLLGPALSWLGKKMFGPTEYETRERQAGSDITGLIGGLESQFGGAEGTAFLADRLGIKWNDARQWRGAGSVDPLRDVVGDIQGGATRGLNDILRAALETGEQFPAALQPALESLIRMGGLTQENANLLRGLPAAGIPSMAEISAAADVLGVDIAALGDSVRQIGLTETAEEAAQAWLTLQRAGADMTAVANASAEQMQGYVDQAIEYGFTLPESLRPAIEHMRELGLISGDLEQIEWAKPLTESVDDLVKALQDLVRTMGGEVTAAIDDLNRREFTVRGRVVVERDERDGTGYQEDDYPTETAHTGGFFGPFGLERYHSGGEIGIIAQTGEYMMQRSAVNRYGRGFMQAVNSGSYQGGGSSPREVVIPVTVQMLDGRVLAEVVARETLQ